MTNITTLPVAPVPDRQSGEALNSGIQRPRSPTPSQVAWLRAFMPGFAACQDAVAEAKSRTWATGAIRNV